MKRQVGFLSLKQVLNKKYLSVPKTIIQTSTSTLFGQYSSNINQYNTKSFHSLAQSMKQAPSTATQTPEEYTVQYEKAMQDISQRIVNILHTQRSCQLSSFGGSETESMEHIKSSTVPMVTIRKQISDIYLEEFKNAKKSKPGSVDEHDVKYYEDESFQGFDDDGSITKNWDIYLCLSDKSDHIPNLEHCPEPFQLRRKLTAEESAMVSLAVGHADQSMTSMFRRIDRLPPRAVLTCTLESIPKESNAFHMIWTEQFRMHPNVSLQMKKQNARIYRVKVIKSAYHIDVGGQMKEVENVEHLTEDVLPDPLSASQNNRSIISRLNSNPQRLAGMLEKGYNLKLSDFFIFELNSYCMRVMGRAASYGTGKLQSSEFSLYELDYGYQITSETMLNQYLARFHAV